MDIGLNGKHVNGHVKRLPHDPKRCGQNDANTLCQRCFDYLFNIPLPECLTESTESTDSNEGGNKSVLSVVSVLSVKHDRSVLSVKHQEASRHEKLSLARAVFRMARQMRAESDEPPNREGLRRMWESRKRFQLIPFDEFRLMASEGWERVDNPQGEGKLAEAIIEADRRGLLPSAAIYEHPTLKRLVGICAVLQERIGDEPFPLAANPLADELNIHQTTAARWIRLLVRDGVLVLVKRGHTGRASEYRFKGTQ